MEDHISAVRQPKACPENGKDLEVLERNRMETIRFDELNLDAKILRAVTDMGFEAASPIQAKAIPLEIEGKDIIGQAQTGTGKTAAFGIPLLQKIDPKNSFRQSCSARRESWPSR